jgi:glycosyltransferase involved in cell wall biosynthesis
MRILHVVTLVDDQASYGGAVTVAVNQCIELRRRGHDASIAAGWGGTGTPPAQLEGVPAHLFRAHPVAPGMGFSALFSSSLVHWVSDHATSFDVAHLHLARDLVPLSVAAVLQRAQVPYVVQTHGALRPDRGLRTRLVDQRMTRRTLLSARHVFVLTPDERDAVARIAGATEGISLLRSGIVLPERVPATSDEGPADVLFLGRLQPSRRVMAFAAAAERLVTDGVEATFSVVGPDGGDLKTLRRFIADRPELAGRLRYEGALPHDQAVDRLRHADLYVLPSVEDQPAPMSLLEAMASGVASICTTECGLAGTLAREGAALVANPSDDAIYGAMRRLLVDRVARARISAAAAATAASVFSMAAVAEVLEEEYALTGDAATTPSPRLLWITDAADDVHAEIWDALRAGTDLTVAVLDTTDPAATRIPLREQGRRALREQGHRSGREQGRRALREQGHRSGREQGRRALREQGHRSGRELRDLIRSRPDVVVLETRRPGLRRAVARWARWSGVRVVTASPERGPGAAAAEATAALPGGSRQVDLDLRQPRQIALPADDGLPFGWQPPAPEALGSVIDLQRRLRSHGRPG